MVAHESAKQVLDLKHALFPPQHQASDIAEAQVSPETKIPDRPTRLFSSIRNAGNLLAGAGFVVGGGIGLSNADIAVGWETTAKTLYGYTGIPLAFVGSSPGVPCPDECGNAMNYR